MTRKAAHLADVDTFAMRLPQVERSTSGGRHSYAVAGRSFVFSRGPRKDAVDPGTGELMEDVLVFSTGHRNASQGAPAGAHRRGVAGAGRGPADSEAVRP